MRRSLTIRLGDRLYGASVTDLMRLAAFCDIPMPRRAGESDGSYKHRLVQAINRWEAKAERGQIALYPDDLPG